MQRPLGHQAIVIGAGIGGLATARVLSDFFNTVLVVEQDKLEESTSERSGIPQGAHVHTLLKGGLNVLRAFFPGLPNELRRHGATVYRLGKEAAYYFPGGLAFNIGCTVLKPFDSGPDLYCQSRGLLERCVRRFVLELPNVTLLQNTSAKDVVFDGMRVTGVLLANASRNMAPLLADLVIDASGQHSHISRWLSSHGFEPAPESVINVHVGYATALYRKPMNYHEPFKMLGFVGQAPNYTRAAVILEIENGLWQVCLAGRGNDLPPADDNGFRKFTDDLPTSKLSQLLKTAQRASSTIVSYRFPRSVWRHYERLNNFPTGLLILGDAICHVNPYHAQGMTMALQQAEALRHILTSRASNTLGLDDLHFEFFAAAAARINAPWMLSASMDFQYPLTMGDHPKNLGEWSQLISAMNARAATDQEVNHELIRIMQLQNHSAMQFSH